MNNVDHPYHYNQSGMECIDAVEGMDFCTGNAIKYLWRHKHKGKPIEDLEKAIWYINRRIEYLKKQLEDGIDYRKGV